MHYELQAAISCTVRADEDRMTYLNKGQYYTLELTYKPPTSAHDMFANSTKPYAARSVVLVTFRDIVQAAEQEATWKFWYSRMVLLGLAKQRVLDYGTQ